MKYCGQCGNVVEGQAGFCGNCGTPVEQCCQTGVGACQCHEQAKNPMLELVSIIMAMIVFGLIVSSMSVVFGTAILLSDILNWMITCFLFAVATTGFVLGLVSRSKKAIYMNIVGLTFALLTMIALIVYQVKTNQILA